MKEITTKQHLSAMQDSVDMINSVLKQEKCDESCDCLDRNYRHLEIMLSKEEIQKSGADLSVFKEAIKAGREFTGIAEGEFKLQDKE